MYGESFQILKLDDELDLMMIIKGLLNPFLHKIVCCEYLADVLQMDTHMNFMEKHNPKSSKTLHTWYAVYLVMNGIKG